MIRASPSALATAVEPSSDLRPLLAGVATELQAGRGAPTVGLALEALEQATSDEDRALAEAWLARALELKGDATAAQGHAELALEAGTPIGVEATVALLGILAQFPDLEAAGTAVTQLVGLGRALSEANGEAPEALRFLAASLDHLGQVRESQGDRAAALAAFEESLGLARRVDERWGPMPESLRDLSVSLDKVGGVRRAQRDLAGALAAFEESLTCYERLVSLFGEPPGREEELAQRREQCRRLG